MEVLRDMLRFWPTFALLLVPAGLFCLLGAVLGFDHETSPAWHFGLYFPALALFMLAPSLIWSHPRFGWLGWWRWALGSLVLVALSLSVALVVHQSGPLLDYRDERTFRVGMTALALGMVPFFALGIVMFMGNAFALLSYWRGWAWGYRSPWFRLLFCCPVSERSRCRSCLIVRGQCP